MFDFEKVLVKYDYSLRARLERGKNGTYILLIEVRDTNREKMKS